MAMPRQKSNILEPCIIRCTLVPKKASLCSHHIYTAPRRNMTTSSKVGISAGHIGRRIVDDLLLLPLTVGLPCFLGLTYLAGFVTLSSEVWEWVERSRIFDPYPSSLNRGFHVSPMILNIRSSA